jgi:hypothetical protein
MLPGLREDDMTREHKKRVVYWCPGCKHEIHRWMDVASLKLESFCSGKGKMVKMRRLRWTRA